MSAIAEGGRELREGSALVITESVAQKTCRVQE